MMSLYVAVRELISFEYNWRGHTSVMKTHVVFVDRFRYEDGDCYRRNTYLSIHYHCYSYCPDKKEEEEEKRYINLLMN